MSALLCVSYHVQAEKLRSFLGGGSSLQGLSPQGMGEPQYLPSLSEPDLQCRVLGMLTGSLGLLRP